jgi:hypothetical protein
MLSRQIRGYGQIRNELQNPLFVRNVPGRQGRQRDKIKVLSCCYGCETRYIEVIRDDVTIPTRGNLFLPVRLLFWADGRGTVPRADSAAWAELQGAPKQKLLQLKNGQKYHWVKHRAMLICCLYVSLDMQLV